MTTSLTLITSLFLVAFTLSMFGLGGGAFYTPILVLFGYTFHQAVATSLLLVFATSLSASTIYIRAHKVDWPVVLVLGGGTATGAFLGGLVADRLSEQLISSLFSVFALVAGIALAFNLTAPKRNVAAHPGWYSLNLPLALPSCLLAGVLSSLIGIGGGIITVPLLTVGFAVPLEIAIGCSAVMVTATSASGLIGHFSSSTFDGIGKAPLLALVVCVGGLLGARISLQANKDLLKRLLGAILVALGLFFAFRG